MELCLDLADHLRHAISTATSSHRARVACNTRTQVVLWGQTRRSEVATHEVVVEAIRPTVEVVTHQEGDR
jgi:hypothetical protein